MARALRVEYPGARCHLLCRGNQSRDIFQHQEDADLFVRCLGEMCHKLWGHLFQGRCKAKVVDDEDASYFRVVSEYIHLNPAASFPLGLKF